MKKLSVILLILFAMPSFGQVFNPSVVAVTDGENSTGNIYTHKIVNGRPAFVYKSVDDTFKYVRANDALGTTWGTPITIISGDDLIIREFGSLEIVNGNPAVAVTTVSPGGGTDRLIYVRANDANGTTWGTPINIATTANQFLGYVSLAVVNNKPAISYVRSWVGTLMYVAANDADGSTWGTPVVIGDLDSDLNSLREVNGVPAIAYRNSNTQDLMYVFAENAAGTIWTNPLTVLSNGNTGSHPVLRLVGGRAAITAIDNDNIVYLRANDANGVSWGTPVIIDTEGRNPVFEVVNGVPVVAYSNDAAMSFETLKFARANDALGSTWATPVSVESSLNTSTLSLTSINGKASIVVGKGPVGKMPSSLVYIQETDLTSFVTLWNLTTSGSGANQLTFGVSVSGDVNYTWRQIGGAAATGSGTITNGSTSATITGLPINSTIELSIAPANFQRIILNSSEDDRRLTDVKQWGNVAWTSMEYAFAGCENLNITATDVPNLTAVESMTGMFRNCVKLNGPPNINSWDVSGVKTMGQLFNVATIFNQNIGSWDVGEVTNMNGMFNGARAFNQDISLWDVAKVETMSGMFAAAIVFNQDIGRWKVGLVKNMRAMFSGASSFDQDIGSWDVDNVMDMSNMFSSASAFNQDISSWNVAKVEDMSQMFNGATVFDQDISAWDVAAVKNMYRMFFSASAFNRDISSWSVQAVTNMSEMFLAATAFNQSLGAWGLKFNASVNLANMLDNCGMNVASYDATLTGFNTGTVTGRTLGALTLRYCAAAADRANLISAKGWTISGDTYNGGCLSPEFTGMPLSVSVCVGTGASFSVTVTNGSSYTWQVNMGSGFVNLSQGGVYSGVNSTTLSISNVAGLNGYQYRCVAGNTNSSINSDPATLTVYAQPTLSVTPPAAQCGGSVDLSTAFSSNGTLSYFLDAGFSSSAINPVMTGGPYYARSTSSNNCTATASVSISINTSATISVTPPAAQCGGSVNLSTAFSSNGSLSYFTSNAFTSSATNPVTTGGPYYARATLGSCTATASVSIVINPLPTISVTPPAAACGGSVDLNTVFGSSNGTLSYFTSNAFTSSATNPVTSGGTYYARSTSSNNCTATASVSISINTSASVNVGALASVVCLGSGISLTASGGGTGYTWSGPQGYSSNSQEPITFAASSTSLAGVYSLTVVYPGGCTASNTVSVGITTGPSVSINNVVCAGNILQLSASGGSSYSWSGPAGFSSTAQNPSRTAATTAMSGTYSVRIASTAGCTGTVTLTASVVVSPRNPLPRIISLKVNGRFPNSQNTVDVPEGSPISFAVTAINSVYYRWESTTGFSSTLQNPTIPSATLANTGEYVVAGYNGCIFFGARTVTVAVVRRGRLASAEEALPSMDLGLEVSPNPSHEWVNIHVRGKVPADTQVRVVDAMGREVHQQVLPAEEPSIRLNVKTWEAGLYIVSAEADGQRVSKKLLKH